MSLDWSRPWLQPYAAQGHALENAMGQGLPLHAALNAVAGRDQPRFVAQQSLPAGQGYEALLHAQRLCPTRDNLHDLLNGLSWLHFPRTKWRFNALHAAEMARRGADPRRGPLRDALTLFDENGALLLAPRGMWDALRARDWQGLFVTRRALWSQARLLVFGHSHRPLAGRVHRCRRVGGQALRAAAGARRTRLVRRERTRILL